MSSLLLVNCLDVARSLGDRPEAATPATVADYLVSEYLVRRGGRFNHNPAIETTQSMFSGLMSVDDAEAHCLTAGNPAGREQNAEIVRLVGPYACARRSRCYKHGFLAVVVGRYKGQSIHVGLKAPFTRVEAGAAYVVLPGFRKTFVPSDAQLRLPCSLAATQLAKDDFRGADVEYLYAGPDAHGKERTFRPILGSSRSLWTADELDDIFDVYVRGVVLALEAGRGLTPPDLAGYRVVDPSAPSLFT